MLSLTGLLGITSSRLPLHVSGAVFLRRRESRGGGGKPKRGGWERRGLTAAI